MKKQYAFGITEVGTSQFYMLRCVVAVAHADGVVTPEEAAFVTEKFEHMPFTSEQKNTLLADLKTPQDVDYLLSHINEPKFRGQVVYFARLLAYKDGNLHPSEDELIKYLHLRVTQNLNMDAIRKDAAAAVAQKMTLHDVQIDSGRPQTGFSWLIDQFFLYCGIDLMDE